MKKFRRSIPKRIEAGVFWLLAAGVIAWLIVKEVQRNPGSFEKTSGREILIETRELHGIRAKSPLVCQGLTVGQVTEVKPEIQSEGSAELSIQIKARLDEGYQKWKFDPVASVEQSSVMAGVMGSSVLLIFNGQHETGDESVQILKLEAPLDTAARIRNLIVQTESAIKPWAEEVAGEDLPADWPKGGVRPTRSEVISKNMVAASDALRSASESFARELDPSHDGSLIGSVHELSGQFSETAKSADSLLEGLDSMNRTVEEKMNDVLGKTAAERARLRHETGNLLSAMVEMVEKFDDLALRTGDTFIGRRLIRKGEPDDPEEKVARKPARAVPTRRVR